jgi:glycosyltransferase involved in cell wall biosynthesis
MFKMRSVREKFVVGLGSLDYIKGVDTAIEALASMPKQRRLSLVWVANSGNPEYASEMEALAESRGVSLTIKRRIMDCELAGLSNRAGRAFLVGLRLQ